MPLTGTSKIIQSSDFVCRLQLSLVAVIHNQSIFFTIKSILVSAFRWSFLAASHDNTGHCSSMNSLHPRLGYMSHTVGYTGYNTFAPVTTACTMASYHPSDVIYGAAAAAGVAPLRPSATPNGTFPNASPSSYIHHHQPRRRYVWNALTSSTRISAGSTGRNCSGRFHPSSPAQKKICLECAHQFYTNQCRINWTELQWKIPNVSAASVL